MRLDTLQVGKEGNPTSTRSDLGVSILLVEQNAIEALNLATRGYVLEEGRIVMEGEAADLLKDERLRRAYLGL